MSQKDNNDKVELLEDVGQTDTRIDVFNVNCEQRDLSVSNPATASPSVYSNPPHPQMCTDVSSRTSYAVPASTVLQSPILHRVTVRTTANNQDSNSTTRQGCRTYLFIKLFATIVSIIVTIIVASVVSSSLSGSSSDVDGYSSGSSSDVDDYYDPITNPPDIKEFSCLYSEQKCPHEDKCIRHSWVCDGENDCADGSDEANCAFKGSDTDVYGALSCNFSSQFLYEDVCNYKQMQHETFSSSTWDKYEWSTESGGGNINHPSANPFGDQNEEYASISSSLGHAGDSALLVSEAVNIVNTNTCLKFWYHMNGLHVGRLSVNLMTSLSHLERNSSIWNRTRQQGNVWRSAAVRLPKGTHYVAFVATRGITDSDYESVIALDNIKATDDKVCSDNPECKSTDFRCGSGECISGGLKCDSVTNCRDASDEGHCSNIKGSCPHGQEKCANENKCIMPEWVCDRESDCADGSDEMNCVLDTCTSNEFTCKNNICIPVIERCDGKRQCTDGSDEIGCDFICGTRSPNIQFSSSYVFGGHDAQVGSWPWQVYMDIGRKEACGGSIINENWVLTAGHCTQKEEFGFKTTIEPSEVTLTIGGLNTDGSDVTAQKVYVDNVIQHPLFQNTEDAFETNIVNDVALLHLKTPLVFNDYIRPVCLPTQNQSWPLSSLCYVSGFGIIDDLDTTPARLKEAKVHLVSQSKCLQFAWKLDDFNMDDSQFCAGYDTSVVGTCKGDSGGPLVCLDPQNRWTLVGSTSWGASICGTSQYSVFANTSHFADWIYEKIVNHDK